MPRAGLSAEVVVAGAADLVDKVSWDGLTMAAVAAYFDVAVPSLYKHVGGFEDLRRRLAVRAVEELGDELTAAVEVDPADGPSPGHGAAPADHRAAMRAMADAYRGYARAHPGRYAATVRAPRPDDADHLAASDRVVRTVLDVLAGYGLVGDDAIDAARMLRSSLHGFSVLEAAGGFGLPRDVDRSFERLVLGLDNALVAAG